LKVQALPSSHVRPARAVTVHDDVPLQTESVQAVPVQAMAVPAQVPAEQLSEWVQASPSSHEPPGRQAHTPPWLVHW
jgi:hypothetical protein